MLEFRLLGPLEVRDGEQALPVRRQKQRALLAALILRAGQPVSKERLVEDLWGAEPPRAAKGALENYVSQLRKVLGKDALVTQPAGYMLHIEPEQVDVLRFERLLEESRSAETEERAAKLREALSLFRGPPLADLVYEPFADGEILRLEELELGAREDLVDAELALGLHAEVVSDLEALVVKHPYRERLRGQLMLALYRSGRQADALAAYQKARGALVDELGIEPSEELQQLEQAVLRQDETLRAPPRTEPAREQAPRGSSRPGRKTVTILYSQVADASSLAERLDPELFGALLDRFVTAARTAVERHGGFLETTPGDSVTAVFGVPAAHEDDALRAVHAAAELRGALAEPHSLDVRTGLSTGEVLVGGFPGGRIATGAAVELAGRLARAAAAGEILLAEPTHELASHAVEVEAVPDGAFRLVELRADVHGRALRLDSPLIGRSRQLAALRRSLEDASEDRSCHLFTVLGAPGVGKSRLAREFVASLGAGVTHLQGGCLPFGESITYRPLIEALGDAAPRGAAEELPGATRKLLETLAAKQPLILVIDDLQWAEPPFLDLVEHIAERSREAPILIVCLARPELLDSRPSWGGGKPNATSVLLEPLTDAECGVLVDNLLGESDLPEPVRAHIIRSSDGNPLFVEELLASLVDRAVLRQEAGRWTTTELPALTVPPSLRALIASRIDLLPDAEREVLEVAAVEGANFELETVAGLAPDDLRQQVEELLSALTRRDLIRPRADREGSFSFRHQLVCDAAYASISKQARADLHERIAQWFERGGHAPESSEIVAYHREQASRYRTELGVEPV